MRAVAAIAGAEAQGYLSQSFKRQGDLIETDKPVDPDLEVTGLQKHMDGGCPVLFNVVSTNNYHPRQSRRLLQWAEKAQAKGVQVNVWTCDDPERMVELVEWGVDGICTNVPDVALSVIAGEPA